jgi:DNA processing protein
MAYQINQISKDSFPENLLELPEEPKQLFLAGNLPSKENKILCVVGSRRHTEYGKEVVRKLISGLADYPITIVSGLALGIDSIAHESALSAGLQTVAVPGSGLDPKVIYPRSHAGLAERIIEKGGGLLSEFEPTLKAAPWTFPQRNRIMAGLSDAILVIEAEEKSGTLITSRLATEYNKDVFAVPGSIFSPQSAGPHMLIRLGATPVRSSQDILEQFGLDAETKQSVLLLDITDEEKLTLELILELNGATKNDILRESKLSESQTQAILMSLEICGLIEEKMGKIFVA